MGHVYCVKESMNLSTMFSLGARLPTELGWLAASGWG